MHKPGLIAALMLLAGTAGASNICTTQNCVVYAETATDLYQIDPVQLTQSHLCAFSGVDGNVNDIAVTGAGVLYALTADELYQVDVSDCSAEPVTSVTGISSAFNGLSFLADGRLIAVDSDGNVAQINTSNGNVTLLGQYGGDLGSSGDVVALADGTIYATAADLSGAESDDILVTLDPSTFEATEVGPISGFSQIFGLGYWAGVLYGFDSAGDVLKIDPSSGGGVVAIGNPGIQWYGAGTTPQAPTTCSSSCTLGSTACDNLGDLLDCTLQSNGCYDWLPTSCGSGQSCSGGACVTSCSNSCIPFTRQCASSSSAQTCDVQSNGCFAWDTVTCPGNTVCSSSSCESSCTSVCSPGQVQCSANTIQGCQQDSNGCYDWVTSTTCGGGEICSSGQCTTSCSDACTAGTTQCSGTFTQSCTSASSGCTEWQNGTDCGAAGCQGGQCCSCVSGQTQCTSDGEIQVCASDPSDPSACPGWVTQTCTSGACQDGVCLTACVASGELDSCSQGAACISVGASSYCGYALPDGGYVPAPPISSSGGDTSGGDSGGTGTSAGTTTGATSGTGDGTSTASEGAATSTGSSGTGGSHPASDNVTSSGCGCGSGSSSSFGLVIVGWVALLLSRRRASHRR